MKSVSHIIVAGAIILLISSCEKIAMNPSPGSDNLSIFNEYAQFATEKYALSEVKGVDLVSLADSIRPFITESLTQEELYDFMSLITSRMREGHTSLTAENIGITPFIGYPWYEGYPPANDGILTMQHYYGEEANPDVQRLTGDSFSGAEYGLLPQDQEIGYIRIGNFTIQNVADSEIEKMMEYLTDTRGLIIDVRGNLGGYVELGARITSYFTEEAYVFGTNFFKNGPGPDDFAPTEMRITPSGSPFTYTKPVMLLQDRISFSTGSLFPVMMSPLEHVTTMGQITGGGTGEIVDGLLSNGWEYAISTSNLVDQQGRPTDNGIEPDIPVVFNPEDTVSDAIIERAILEIQSK